MPDFKRRPGAYNRIMGGFRTFAKRAVDWLGDAQDFAGALHGSQRGDATQNPFDSRVYAGDDVVDELSKHSIVLNPLINRRAFDGFEGVPQGLKLGWAQLTQTRGQAFSIGVFPSPAHFSQIALADAKGRVFIGSDPQMDTHALEPRFMFGKEDNIKLPDGPRFGHSHTGIADAGTPTMNVVQGGIVGRDVTGHMTWLASWLRTGNRYTLEQLRAPLPEEMRFNLEYRDAITIAFFGAYMLPQIEGLLIGFGSGNIFRRLNREAPIGAIRRSVQDSLEARSHGLRVSGLEDHFADLMREAGALEHAPGLEAVHGAEPLHLYTSSYSGSYFFSWDSSMEFSPALRSLKIEGNLNRFAAVSAWLEHNARIGAYPNEDTVTRAQAAQIDFALLLNPALIALPPESAENSPTQLKDLSLDDGKTAVLHLITAARKEAATISAGNPGPVNLSGDTPAQAQGGHADAGGSQWVYRQTLAKLLRRLRLPYRFDVEFRSNLDEGTTGIAFTTAGMSMMPASRYDERTHSWLTLSDDERAMMSTQYNLRVGLMMAALSFGADARIKQVSLRIDSIGLEEAVAEQDSAIAKLMSQALSAFERIRSGDISFSGSKADPKDGDIHGDPTKTTHTIDGEEPHRADTSGDIHRRDEGVGYSQDGPSDEDHAQDDVSFVHGAQQPQPTSPDETAERSAGSRSSGDSTGTPDVSGANPTGSHAAPYGSAPPASTGSDSGAESDESSLDRRFEDLIRDVDIDDMTFNTPQGPQNGGMSPGGDGEGEEGDAAEQGEGDDPISTLRRNPTVRNLGTVTFTREEFFECLHCDGLLKPIETYRAFGAMMDVDGPRGFKPVNAQFDLRDTRFSPKGAQEEPELSEATFTRPVARILGAGDATGLSIQRADLLQRAVADFHRLAADDAIPSVDKARRAMRLVERIGDPELAGLAPRVSSALIDGKDTPDLEFTLAHELDAQRIKARDLLFSGQTDQAIQTAETEIARLDSMFRGGSGVPRYFNSYAERVVYNRLFATTGERTVLIPDNLFYAHMELADLLAQLKGAEASLPHLNAMVSYAPAYPLSHMKLAVQLARNEDWDSARAACLNALRVALDRDDAAFAYYRFAYAAWMRDEFDVAAAAYIMSDHIASGQIGALQGELNELIARAQSQCIRVPQDVNEAQQVLKAHELPVWPHTEVATIVRDAARVCVDNGMFVPARTLSVAAARMNDGADDGIDMAQAQFLRSLNA